MSARKALRTKPMFNIETILQMLSVQLQQNRWREHDELASVAKSEHPHHE